jgi:hypothetical protein
MKMEKSESIFNRVIEFIDCTPWDLRYHLESEGTDFGGDKTRIYLVDTLKGWYAHAAVSAVDYIEAAAELADSDITHNQLTLVANAVIHSAKDDTVTPEEAELYLSITALWLAGTETFKQLQENGALGAHVFAFSYTGEGGYMVLRPTAAIDQSVNFYPIEEVLGLTRQVIAMDVGNTTTHVGRSLAAAGGAKLSPIFL